MRAKKSNARLQQLFCNTEQPHSSVVRCGRSQHSEDDQVVPVEVGATEVGETSGD